MNKKMTLADLKSMYPPFIGNDKPGRDGFVKRKRATLRGHRHKVNPVWLPGTPSITPAQFRRRHLGRTK
jgi:hypothetical protein